MKKTLILIAILVLALCPTVALASPGQLDQYGGHNCAKDCALYGLGNDEYHFHEIPASPSYLSGFIDSSVFETLFYWPKVKAEETAQTPISITGNDLNTLTANTVYDSQLCQGAEIFATGRYTADPKVRVSPVCVQRDIDVLKIATLNSKTDYYKSLSNENFDITKVYHVQVLNDGRIVFTDMPEISELKGLIIQGVTDISLYYVNPNDENLALRPITIEKAIQLKGVNYKMGIAYFDDSLIFSYPIARPLL